MFCSHKCLIDCQYFVINLVFPRTLKLHRSAQTNHRQSETIGMIDFYLSYTNDLFLMFTRLVPLRIIKLSI